MYSCWSLLHLYFIREARSAHPLSNSNASPQLGYPAFCSYLLPPSDLGWNSLFVSIEPPPALPTECKLHEAREPLNFVVYSFWNRV